MGNKNSLSNHMSIIQRILARFLKKGPVEVQFENQKTVTVPHGTSILNAALNNDIDLDHFCGGTCSCSTCRVEILSGGENLSKMKPNESMVLGHEKSQRGDRLSCQAKAEGTVVVRIPDYF